MTTRARQPAQEMPAIAVLSPVAETEVPPEVADQAGSADTDSAELQNLTIPADLAQLSDPDKPASRSESKESKAKAGPPALAEWQDFFARVVIRIGTNLYMDFALRDIAAEDLTPSEIVELRLDDDDRKAIAKPFAEFANKLPITRKHGRMIIASADSLESLIVLWKWTRTVNRVGNRHRPNKGKRNRQVPQQQQQQVRKEANGHGDIGPSGIANVAIFEGFEGS